MNRPLLAYLSSLLILAACDSTPIPIPTPIPTPAPIPTQSASPITQPTPTNPPLTATTLITLTPPFTTTSTVATPTPNPRTPTPSVSQCAPNAATAPRDGIGDPFYTQLGNSGYDTQRYTIDLTVDLERNTVSGTTTIRALATRDLSAFNLDFEQFSVSGIEVNGASAQHTRRENELTVTPASGMRAGAAFTVTVAYSGEPNSDRERGAIFSEGWTRYDSGVFVAGEPSGASSWYPVNDHPCDKALYNLRITVPEPYVVAANGTLRGETDNGSTRTYTFDTRDPMASYLVTVNIAEYERVEEQGPDGLPIRNYFPKNLDADQKANYARTGEMIEYFNGLFGPYPFEVYGAVVVDEDLGFALETQTLSLFGRSVGGIRASAEEVIAHELAHQWFGNSVSLRTWRDIWLNEGFASYAEWLWIEHTEGRDRFLAHMRGVHGFARNGDLGPPADPDPDDLFNPTVYVRGGLTLHALRAEIGDDAFFRALRAYATQYRNSNANTAQFIAVAERESGKELDEFFQAWLYGEETPDLP